MNRNIEEETYQEAKALERWHESERERYDLAAAVTRAKSAPATLRAVALAMSRRGEGTLAALLEAAANDIETALTA